MRFAFAPFVTARFGAASISTILQNTYGRI
jgi:hypothetical protein